MPLPSHTSHTHIFISHSHLHKLHFKPIHQIPPNHTHCFPCHSFPTQATPSHHKPHPLLFKPLSLFSDDTHRLPLSCALGSRRTCPVSIECPRQPLAPAAGYTCECRSTPAAVVSEHRPSQSATWDHGPVTIACRMICWWHLFIIVQ